MFIQDIKLTNINTDNNKVQIKKPALSFCAIDSINIDKEKEGKTSEDKTSVIKDFSKACVKRINEAVNVHKLKKLFLDHGTIVSSFDVPIYRYKIKKLSKMDYEQVEQKYLAILRHDGSFSLDRKTDRDVLLNENITARDIDDIQVTKLEPLHTQELLLLFNMLEKYENIENLSTYEQQEILKMIKGEFYLKKTEVERFSKDSPLFRYKFIRDIKECKDIESLMADVKKSLGTSSCKAINVNDINLLNVISSSNIDKLKETLNKTDLQKYKKGFALKYPRKSFIEDFNKIIQDLPNSDKNKVFKHFDFKINTAGDIVKYPNPDSQKKPDENLKPVIDKAQLCVEKFMLENKVILNPEDSELELLLNDIIQAFPEFISIIGKIQHRGDSIDFHTFDDLKRIMNSENYLELPEAEKRIMFVATLFHDFAKEEHVVDPGHAKKSALLAKEIIKKMPVSFDEKERIYNLIAHGHWLVDGDSFEDIAFYFRRPNDFKMAQIFARADSNSAGFYYQPDPSLIDEVVNNIDKINKNGILLFADSLPVDKTKYDTNKYGVKYLDLRDPEASVEKYGYPKGTKVKDLKFLCHSSQNEQLDFSTLCDDSKNVCLSTSLVDRKKGFSIERNDGETYILSGNNANLIIGGKNICGTGAKRDYNYAKNAMYKNIPDYSKPFRSLISDMYKDELNLSDEDYLKLYNQICNLDRKEEIKDVELNSGRILSRSEIIKILEKIQKEMVTDDGSGIRDYINEFVVYNPKIEAIVKNSKDIAGDIDSIKQSKHPVILV